MFKILNFETLKISPESNFQLFFGFIPFKSSLGYILSSKKNRMTPPTFLLFYFAKTAKTAEFTRKPRYFKIGTYDFFFDPKFVISDKK